VKSIVSVSSIIKVQKSRQLKASNVKIRERKAFTATALPGLVSLRSETVTLLAVCGRFWQLSGTRGLEKSSLTTNQQKLLDNNRLFAEFSNKDDDDNGSQPKTAEN
jgi:hypothetical protein